MTFAEALGIAGFALSLVLGVREILTGTTRVKVHLGPQHALVGSDPDDPDAWSEVPYAVEFEIVNRSTHEVSLIAYAVAPEGEEPSWWTTGSSEVPRQIPARSTYTFKEHLGGLSEQIGVADRVVGWIRLGTQKVRKSEPCYIGRGEGARRPRVG